jgi:hypothetical protein
MRYNAHINIGGPSARVFKYFISRERHGITSPAYAT